MEDTLSVLARFAAQKRKQPIAAFDFDSTCRIYRGRGFDEEQTSSYLSLLATRFNVVVISNRADGLIEYADKVDEKFKKRHEGAEKDAENKCVLPSITVMGSKRHDRFRKPHRGMWELYLDFVGHQLPGSFFCGDAAGRPGDFSGTDCAFALNCNLAFIVPERIFGTLRCSWKEAIHDTNPSMGYDEKTLEILNLESLARHGVTTRPRRESQCQNMIRPIIEAVRTAFEKSSQKENTQACIVLMGASGSGKTSIAMEFKENGYAVLMRENVPEAKFLKNIEWALKTGSTVIVDGTHPSAESRAKVLKLAKTCEDKKVMTMIVHVDTPKGMCRHLNAVRCEISHCAVEVPAVAFNTYWKNFEPPSPDEADKIITLPFALWPECSPEVTKFRYEV